MLTIAGPQSRFCDGLSRRSWLRIGSLGLGGLGLPDILRAEAASGARASSDSKRPAKGIIMVLLPGGPSHLDLYDLNPDAPAEIRGEFRPMATNVPGIEICELLPRLAEALDLSREEPAVRSRYGLDRHYPDEREGKTLLDQFLLVRRVIEAGARCVTLSFSRWPFGRMLTGDFNWDWHKNLFAEARGTLPLLDLGLSGLMASVSSV